jgi:RNA polymerase sporulation-specific sigma factor
MEYEGMDNEEIVVLAQAGDEAAENYLFKKNKGFIHYIVNKYNVSEQRYDEFMSLAMYGFLKAIRAYRIETEFKFLTLARKCMMNEIGMQLRKKENFIVSLDEVIGSDGEGGNLVVGDTLDNGEEPVEETVIKNDRLERVLNRYLKCLKIVHRKIVIDYYLNEMTQVEIAEKYNRSQAWVKKVLGESIMKMKRVSRLN